jgi:hypothetical protein
MISYLKACHGFEDENIVILMDDGEHKEPTARNIKAAYRKVAADAEPGDAIFCHYSGTNIKQRRRMSIVCVVVQGC